MSRSRPRILGIVSDLDGTLLRSDGVLSPASIRLLEAARWRGIPLLVATARTPRAVRKIHGYRHLGRMVCANGAVVWDARRDEVLRASAFEPMSLVPAIARLRDGVPHVGVALLSPQRLYLDETYLGLRKKKEVGAHLYSDPERVVDADPVVMLAVRHPGLSADQLEAPAAEAFANIGQVSSASTQTVDIVPRGAAKDVAAARELAEAGCAGEATVVFGDMPNDLPLFAWAGWACAMANSHPRVLEAADEVVPGNDDDGVARTVARILGI